jgi:NitT/TauT family transport system ATP-binding protein
MNAIIEFKNVGKRYPEEKTAAVQNVSFSVAEGEFLCFIGPSGGGKTTTLKLIAGLELPTSGVVTKPAKVAMAFQMGALFPWLTAFENVALGLRQTNMSEREVAHIVERELRATGMLAFHDKYPADLSGGQRQRVGIARALAVDPAVLLLDEPFSALDPKTTAELHDDVLKIWHDTKKTIVMVSHLIEEAVGLADRIILMREGTIDSEYAIAIPHPRHEQGAEFMRDVQRIRKEFFK